MIILTIAYILAVTALAVKFTFEAAFLKEELYDVKIEQIR
jgi:hypothetical protein